MENLIRLQKVIAERGYCSRRKAEELIIAGLVKVNGEIISTLGTKIDPSADIEIEGYDLKTIKESKKTFVFNKPFGVVTTTKDDRGRPTVMEYFHGEDERLYPVGRLDYNTTGCLLVTNDGELAQLSTHPSSHLPKTYVVKVNGYVTDEALRKLHKGIMLDDGLTAPARVLIGRRNREFSLFKIIIHEGRNRQVRRMCEAVGFPVVSLCRESVGPITCVGVQKGEYRKLTDEEVQEIKRLCKKNQKLNVIPSYKLNK